MHFDEFLKLFFIKKKLNIQKNSLIPVPSIMAVTVANAFEEPCNEGWTPRSAETAVVIKAYGPLTIRPTNNNSPTVPE